MNKENIMETMDIDKTNEKQSHEKSSIEGEGEVGVAFLYRSTEGHRGIIVDKTGETKKTKKTKKVRCSFCNKKCNMINITCKCGGVYCQTHMSLSSHKCKGLINKKEEVKDTIASQNPKMNTSKMVKI